MARLSRLSLAHVLHFVVQQGHGSGPIFVDDIDRAACLQALRDAAALHQVAVHAYAVWDHAVLWLATPSDTAGISRTVQAMGQRFVAGFNRRHGSRGTRWDGRFRCAVVDAGTHALRLAVLMEQGPQEQGSHEEIALEQGPALAIPSRLNAQPMALRHVHGWPWSSAGHHTGAQRTPWLVDMPSIWALGNTPFDRESAYRRLLLAPRDEALHAEAMHAAARGWVLGGDAFVRAVAAAAGRAVAPRPRGRPKRIPGPLIAMSPIKALDEPSLD
jgi:putative transposase